MPELFSLELSHLFPDLEGAELMQKLASFSDALDQEFRAIVRRDVPSLVAGSHLIERDGVLANVSGFYSAAQAPSGPVWQPKNVMTQFEAVEWGVRGAESLFPYRVGGVRTGTLICYDSEFPEAGRAMAEAGVRLINVPSFTETQRGFQRVRWSCQARAIENQVFVVHATLAGDLGREPVPMTHGTSAVLCPSVAPFPESAVLAETKHGEEGLAVAMLDFETLELSRNSDDVRNWHDRHASKWTIESAP